MVCSWYSMVYLWSVNYMWDLIFESTINHLIVHIYCMWWYLFKWNVRVRGKCQLKVIARDQICGTMRPLLKDGFSSFFQKEEMVFSEVFFLAPLIEAPFHLSFCRCYTCHGHGMVVCKTCAGHRNLKCYIKLTVTW